MSNKVKKYLLPYAGEIGSQLVKIDTVGFDLTKKERLTVSDKHFVQRYEEIKQELSKLLEEKTYNDIIWSNIKFEPNDGQIIFLYQKPTQEYLVSIIGPNEWKGKFEFIDKFILTSKSNIFVKLNNNT